MVAIHWTTMSELIQALDDYGDRLYDAIEAEGAAFADHIQGEARQNAPWNDRTGNARRGLVAIATMRDGILVIALGHTVTYGWFLERGTTRMTARPIVMPTLQANYERLMSTMQELME